MSPTILLVAIILIIIVISCLTIYLASDAVVLLIQNFGLRRAKLVAGGLSAIMISAALFTTWWYSSAARVDAQVVREGPGVVAAQGTAASVRERDLNQSLEQLEIQLKRQPQDVETMVLFARTLAELNRYPAAAIAYSKVAAVLPTDPTLQIEWANAEYMANDQKWTPVAIAALARGIELAPKDPEALWLAGKERFENKDFVKAVRYWESLESVIPPGSENARELKTSLEQARTLRDGRIALATEPTTAPAAANSGDQPKVAAAPSKIITGTVSLDARLNAHAAPDDKVYIFARDATEAHAPLPLAILRHRVADLPLTFELSDNNIMSAQTKLANAPKVIVTARISKSGDTRPQSGDLEGSSLPIPPGTERVAIVINSAR